MGVNLFEQPKKTLPRKKSTRVGVASRAPQNLARLVIQHKFTEAGKKSIVAFNGSMYVHRGGSYVKIDTEQVKAVISRFIDREVELKDGQDIVAPTSWHVNEVFTALSAQVLLPPETQPPCWLGTGRPPWGERVITLRNGVLDLSMNKLFTPDPHWFALDGLAVDYDQQASCPLFTEKLTEWFPRDEQARDCLQECLGYLIEGSNDLEKILVFVGGPRSGKGTNARILEAIFRGSLVKPLLSSFVGPFGAESLTDASIALFTDARLGKNADTAGAIEKMLAISGRDSPGVPRKYKSDYSGTIRARIVMLCNELPYLPDASGALGNRFILLRFPQCFLGREDPNLSRRLQGELPGIVNFALRGLKRLRDGSRGGFTLPAASIDLLQDYIDGSSPLADFLLDSCAFGAEYQVGKDDLYTAGYLSWARDRGIKRPLGRSQFYRLLAPTRNVDISCRCDPDTGTTLAADGSKPPRHVHGLRLK